MNTCCCILKEMFKQKEIQAGVNDLWLSWTSAGRGPNNTEWICHTLFFIWIPFSFHKVVASIYMWDQLSIFTQVLQYKYEVPVLYSSICILGNIELVVPGPWASGCALNCPFLRYISERNTLLSCVIKTCRGLFNPSTVVKSMNTLRTDINLAHKKRHNMTHYWYLYYYYLFICLLVSLLQFDSGLLSA